MEPFNRRSCYRLSERAVRLFEPLSHQAGQAALVESISALSTLFTRERAGISARYLDDSFLSTGYLSYFLPVNFAKVQVLLNEVPDEWANKSMLSVLDVGAGPGTASLAALDWVTTHRESRPSLCVSAMDHSQAALVNATHLWNTYRQQVGAADAELVTSVVKLEKLGKPEFREKVFTGAPYDLIIVANCLNELFHESADPPGQRVTFVERLLSVLKPDGTLMILEPALRSIARALHQTRDRLLERGSCSIYSPCLHEHLCPALTRPDDWCHEERPWLPPPWIVSLDERLGFIKDALKFSYVLLRKDGRTIVPRQPNVYRVVSELRVFKGEKRAWLCNETGRSEVGRLDRKASDANRRFDDVTRGTLVQIERILRKERSGTVSKLGRILEDSQVRIVREA